jgi:uroporphyrinogen decarboxylase
MAKGSLYRERFAATLMHRPVDRCPIDLGGTPQSTIEDQETVEGLAAYLGLAGAPPADYDKLDGRILECFDVDFRRVGNLVSFTTQRDRRLSSEEYVDCYGIRHRFSGMYWEIVEGPLHRASIDDVTRYQLPTLADSRLELFDKWATQARRLHEQSPYVVVAEHPVFGVLELACWLCGYDHIMMMLALDPEFIHLLFGKILEFQKPIIREYYRRLGPYIHLTTSGDDFGTQKGPFMSPAMWREFVKPYMRERIAYTAQFTGAAYMHHSCGSIFGIIPDLIEIGVKGLNPIQPSAQGMEPARLKAAFGQEIVFHGGLDTQEVLPSNDYRRIDEAVEGLLSAMDPQGSGGYVFAPAHNLQRDVSPGSIAQMYRAVLRAQARSEGPQGLRA